MKSRSQVSGLRSQNIREDVSRFLGTSRASRAFTLIETLAAVTLLVVAVVSPMLLTERSLTSAYYARDQITASYLGQEAIEQIHQLRDGNILKIANCTANCTAINLFDGLPSVSGAKFVVDAITGNMATCGSTCPPLQTQAASGLYGYSCTLLSGITTCAPASGWSNTNFTRYVTACYVQPPPSTLCNGAPSDEVRVSVTVWWRTSSLQTRKITMSENLYRWIADGSGT